MDEIVEQLSKKLAKMALAFTCCPPYSALKLRWPCSQIFFLCQKPVDVTNKVTRYKLDGMAVI